ncbi:MAG TPA: M1 family metallopeptidase, partial [Thermoanaerobacterales bacterium]|nr:M1 family metallopeptidase [Thermoanaerobacterales bacterium]
FEHVYGKKTGDTFYEDYILNPYRFYELGHTSGHILRPLSEFSDWGEYDAVIYSRGAIVLRELERRVGKAKFREALRVYFQQNMYKNASTQDFIEALNRVTGTDWTDYILNQLNSSEPLKDAA